ncbi:MAG: methyltransferase domain-containing protein [Thermoplasmata archaeon]|nr:methyltransferase domain-containing protein [Thermoplasmata archaeon]
MEPTRSSTPHAELHVGRTRVPLGFVQEGRRVYLVARDRSAGWPTVILREGRARLDLPEGDFLGTSRLVRTGADRQRILELFRTKYGPSAFQRWYDRPARVLEIVQGEVAVDGPPADRYYRWLETEFDVVAPEYDHHILDNRMNRLLRDRSLALLRPTFRDRRLLLEVGCGSGIETLQLLAEGHEITAVDLSPEMLSVVREKARSAGCSERLRTVRARAAEIGQHPELAGLSPFDGAYSTYGAINCEPDLAPVERGFAALLPPKAPLVLGIYNRWCAFELIAYGLTGRLGRALGRRTNPVPVGSSRFCVDVFAYSLGDVRREFRTHFVPRESSAVPLFLPPSDLTGYAEKFAAHFATLDRWDRRAGRFPGLAGWGDHFLLRLDRR